MGRVLNTHSALRGRDQRGFTLVEMLVVVIIIGILAGVAIPVFLNQKARGYEAQVKAQVATIAKAAEEALSDTTSSASLQRATGASLVTAGGTANAAVAPTAGVEWDIAGSGGAYCIVGWSSHGGKYTPSSPLVYDSTKGGITAGSCDDVPNLPVDFVQGRVAVPSPTAPLTPSDGFLPSSTMSVYSYKSNGVRGGPAVDAKFAFEITSRDNGTFTGVLTAAFAPPAGYTAVQLNVGYQNVALGASACTRVEGGSASGYPTPATARWVLTCPTDTSGLYISSAASTSGCTSTSTSEFCAPRPTTETVYFVPGHPSRPDTPPVVPLASDTAGWANGTNTVTLLATASWPSAKMTISRPTVVPTYGATGPQTWTSTWDVFGVCHNGGWSPPTMDVTAHWRRTDTNAIVTRNAAGASFSAGAPFYQLGYPCSNRILTGTVTLNPPTTTIPANAQWVFDHITIGQSIQTASSPAWYPEGHPLRP